MRRSKLTRLLGGGITTQGSCRRGFTHTSIVPLHVSCCCLSDNDNFGLAVSAALVLSSKKRRLCVLHAGSEYVDEA